MRQRLLLGMLLLGTIGCGPKTISRDWQRIEPPVLAPDFTVARLDGGVVRLSDSRGRVVILDFWATWCSPCRFSLPSLEVIATRYADRGVSVFLVNAGEPGEEIHRWRQHGFKAPVLLDQQGLVRQLYGVRGIPRLFILDQEGRVIYTHAGYGGGLERNLKLILDQLLAEESHG